MARSYYNDEKFCRAFNMNYQQCQNKSGNKNISLVYLQVVTQIVYIKIWDQKFKFNVCYPQQD